MHSSRFRSGSRERRATITALLSAAAVLLPAASAAAATVHVETSGTDGAGCGSTASPCLTVARGVSNAAAGDTVKIGLGTFPMTTSVALARSVTVSGQGDGTTLDGENGTGLTANGAFQITAPTNSTVIVERVRFIRTARWTSTKRAYAVIGNTLNGALDITVRHITFIGSDGVLETPLNIDNNFGRTAFEDNSITNVHGNAILMANQHGPLSVQRNDIQIAPGTTDSATYQYMNDGFNHAPVTGEQVYRGNSITGGGGLRITSAFSAPSQFTGGVTVENNIITPLAGKNGIGITNDDTSASGEAGRIDRLQINSNIITGAGTGAGVGVNVIGHVPGATIAGNAIRRFGRGVVLDAKQIAAGPPPTLGPAPTGADLHRNQLVDNGAADVKTGLFVAAQTSSILAVSNWWGCSDGPPIGTAAVSSRCDSVVAADPADVNAANWIVLGLTGTPATLAADGEAAITADVTHDNTGAPAPGTFRDGWIVPLLSSGGSLADEDPPLIAGVAQTTFRSSQSTGRSVSAQVDHESVTVTWPNVAPGPEPVPVPEPGPAPADTAKPDTFPNTGGVGSVTELTPACLPLHIVDVAGGGENKTIVRGVTRAANAGKRVKLYYQPSGSKVIAQPTVDKNGRFTATVKRPKSPKADSDKARYRAALGKLSTPWVKLTRVLTNRAIRAGGTQLTVSGQVSRAAPGARVRITRSDTCGRYVSIGSVKIDRKSGRFSGTVPAVPNPQAEVVGIRLVASVRRGGDGPSRNKTSNTYSIVQPVLIR